MPTTTLTPTTSSPTTTPNPYPGWSDAGRAIWEAAQYAVPGSTFAQVFAATPDLFTIAIIGKWKVACQECMMIQANDPDHDCPECVEHELIKGLLNSTTLSP